MWIPVISDSGVPGAMPHDESALETLLATVPPALLTRISFVWVRDAPSPLAPRECVLAFRCDAPAVDRLAALVSDPDGRVLIELYAANVASSLSDRWLAENWGIQSAALPLSNLDKLQVTLFALLLHWAVREGELASARILIRRIGRVIFRAAVRRVCAQILPAAPVRFRAGGVPADTLNRPISAAEVARTDMDALLRRLLGLDVFSEDQPAYDGQAGEAARPDEQPENGEGEGPEA